MEEIYRLEQPGSGIDDFPFLKTAYPLGVI